MNADAQRIACAELEGWKLVARKGGAHDLFNPAGENIVTRWKPCVLADFDYWFPDYLSCLNAATRLEEKLTDDEYALFEDWLERLVLRATKDWRKARRPSATAPQRVEAILRATGRCME